MIAVFSGTGNSLAVARRISEILGDGITHIAPGTILAPGSERIIWVFPVYSWGLPPVVDDFIAAQTALAGRPHYCVLTCGDDVGLADRRWRRAVERRGATDIRACRSVQMPNTYVCMKGFDVDSPELAQSKVEASGAAVDTICRDIEAGAADSKVTRGAFAWIKTAVIYPWFRRHCMSPRRFRTSDGCTACGLCARSCPLGNITLDGAPGGRSPAWHDRCTLCLRCYHICPHHAVHYGRATRGKGQKHVKL